MSLSLHQDPELPQLLRKQLASGIFDSRWRHWLAPQLAYGRHEGPPRNDAGQAAVAIVLYRTNSQWHMPLTVRPAALRTHGGQVSFPGGTLEPEESSQEAAHRELVEELFTNRRPQEVSIEWLGALRPLFVFVSNILVTPWIGVLHEPSLWQPQPAEVERVLPLPLSRLLGDNLPDMMKVQRGSLEFGAPRLIVDGCDVWGTTGVLLGELRGRLRALTGETV